MMTEREFLEKLGFTYTEDTGQAADASKYDDVDVILVRNALAQARTEGARAQAERDGPYLEHRANCPSAPTTWRPGLGPDVCICGLAVALSRSALSDVAGESGGVG